VALVPLEHTVARDVTATAQVSVANEFNVD